MTLCAVRQHLWELGVVDLPGVQIQQGYLGTGNIVEGVSAKSGTLFYAPLSAMNAHRANGARFEHSSCMILKPGTEFNLSISDNHHWCTVVLPWPDSPNTDGPEQRENHESVVARCNSWHLQLFRSAVKDIVSVARWSPGFESSPAGENAARYIRRLVSRFNAHPPATALQQSGKKRGRPRYPIREIVDRCKYVEEKHEGARITVKQLAAASGVSERTLRNAFHSYYGLSPSRYLAARLLKAVHRDLLIADPEAESVTGILLRRGVWEVGRFACNYRRFYGEVPSATLRRLH